MFFEIVSFTNTHLDWWTQKTERFTEEFEYVEVKQIGKKKKIHNIFALDSLHSTTHPLKEGDSDRKAFTPTAM